MKAFKEGKNLQHSVHVKSVFFHRITETIKFCFIKALVAPQTRITESPYSVCVCLRNDNSSILTGECTCLTGSSYSCKHVFALLHFIENEVHIGRKKSCTEKKQQWDVRVSKKQGKIHKACEMSFLIIQHPCRKNEIILKTFFKSSHRPFTEDFSVDHSRPY